MKSIKVVLVVAIGMVFTGCATVGNGNVSTVDKMIPIAKTAAYVGTFYAMKEHPEWRPSFETAVAELKFLEAQEKIEFVTLISIVNRLPIKELQSDEAALIVGTATILLSEYGGMAVPLEQVKDLHPVVTAIRDGIELALVRPN